MTSVQELSDRLQNISLKPSDHVFVFKILTNDLIFEVIFDACTPATFFKLSRTCRIAYAAVRFYVGRAFNINRHLSQYFSDPLAFRSLQARTAALVSGSNALQFFNRLTYDNSDLDVYVSWKSAVEVGRWMLGQGYTYKPSVSQRKDLEQEVDDGHPAAFRGEDDLPVDIYGEGKKRSIRTVLMFVKPSEHDTEKELQVHVIVSFSTPMEVIMRVHSTAVLNVIAWDTAYSLYPYATFEGRYSLLLHHLVNPSQGFQSAIQKYEQRGWIMINSLSSRRTFLPNYGFTLVHRWIGDGFSWTMHLPTEGVTPPLAANEYSVALTRDPCIATDWQLDEEAEIVVEVVADSSFRYAYMTAGLDTRTVRIPIDVGTPSPPQPPLWAARGKRIVTARRSKIRYRVVEIQDIGTAFERIIAYYQPRVRPNEGHRFLDEELIQFCVNSLEKQGEWRLWHH